MRLRRRNTLWLTVLGAMASIAAIGALAGAAAALPVVLAVLALFGIAAIASLVDVRPADLVEGTRSSLLVRKMTPEAREASERARRRAGGNAAGYTLLSVGMLSMVASPQGIVMRRTRSVTKDEDAIRPFIKLHVGVQQADRQAIVRWELIDQNGDVQYIHEMKQYLREGEVDIIADHQLPLAGNAKLTGAGQWDLRVAVDGVLLGVHSFHVAPSYAERFPHLAQQQQAADQRTTRRTLSDEGELNAPPSSRRLRADPDEPVSLEDLLRSGNSGRPRDDRPNDARLNDARSDGRNRR